MEKAEGKPIPIKPIPGFIIRYEEIITESSDVIAGPLYRHYDFCFDNIIVKKGDKFGVTDLREKLLHLSSIKKLFVATIRLLKQGKPNKKQINH